MGENEPIKMISKYKAEQLHESKKYDREHYEQRLENINSVICLVGEYYTMKTKTLHLCRKHNELFYIAPDSAVRGAGCSLCKKEKYFNSRSKTREQYINELSDKNPDIELVGEYLGYNNRTTHKCLIHDELFETSPCDALDGAKCLLCKKEKLRNMHLKTHDEYLKDLQNIQSSLIPIEEYIDIKTSIDHMCTKHNNVVNVPPIRVLRGQGCQECMRENYRSLFGKSKDEYQEELKRINPNVIIVGEYTNAHTSTDHLCLRHQQIFNAPPASVRRGGGCSICHAERIGQALKYTTEEYKEILRDLNPDVVVVDEYINMLTSIKHRCLIHNRDFYNTPANVLNRLSGCILCHETTGEKKIRQWLEKNNILYIPQKRFDDCKDINLLPFDFYSPHYNLCIEYDGIQHFESIDFFGGDEAYQYTVKHDQLKNEYCKNNNISLLRIRYDEDVEEVLNYYFTTLIQ